MAWWLGSYQFQSRWMMDTTNIANLLPLLRSNCSFLQIISLCFAPLTFLLCIIFLCCRHPYIASTVMLYLHLFPCILNFSSRCPKTLYIFLIPLTARAVFPSFYHKYYNNWMNANFEHIYIYKHNKSLQSNFVLTKGWRAGQVRNPDKKTKPLPVSGGNLKVPKASYHCPVPYNGYY